MAPAVVKPTGVYFIEIATHSESLELEVGAIQIDPLPALANVAIKDSGIRQDHGVIIVAVKKHSGAMVFNPPPDLPFAPQDRLVDRGDPEQLKRLEERATRK